MAKTVQCTFVLRGQYNSVSSSVASLSHIPFHSKFKENITWNVLCFLLFGVWEKSVKHLNYIEANMSPWQNIVLHFARWHMDQRI